MKMIKFTEEFKACISMMMLPWLVFAGLAAGFAGLQLFGVQVNVFNANVINNVLGCSLVLGGLSFMVFVLYASLTRLRGEI